MTKLLIYRGDAVHGEYELKGQTLRIGRSPQNDIILEDPSKGVSRNHAEIRAEGGHYMLVDLESQNGIWVHGSKVPSVRLDPGVTAALGPFRLTTVEAAAAAAPAAVAEFVTEPTEYSHPEGARTPPEAVDGPGALLDPGPSAALPGTAQIPVTPAAGTPAPPPAATATPQRSAAPVLVAAVAVIVVLGASALAGYAWLHKRTPKPVWDQLAAVALVNDGKCAEAMQQQIGPALNANPNDAEALALKDRCAPPAAPAPPSAPAPPPAPVEKTVAQKLDDVEASLAANNCQAALDAVNAVLSDNPDDTRAKELAAKANACLTPAAAVPATPEPPPGPVKVAAAQGGLDVQPGESQREYTRRVAAMRKRYEDAAALVQGQHYQQALKELDAIAAAVPSGYLDLAKLRADARAGIKDEAAGVYASAKQAEQQGDLNAALQRFERAHDLDSSIDVSTDTARVNDQKIKLGHQACTTGHANFALGHNADAAVQYQRVLDFLPDSDPCYAIAKQRLAQIKR